MLKRSLSTKKNKKFKFLKTKITKNINEINDKVAKIRLNSTRI